MKKLLLIALVLFVSFQSEAQRNYGQQKKQKAKKEKKERNDKKNNGHQSVQGTIYGNTILQRDAYYYSADGQYYFSFQSDGNLVVNRASGNQVLWSSGTQGRAVRAEFQRDGNLVLTDNNGSIVWDAWQNQANNNGGVAESATAKKARARRNALIMQNDGNLVIYTGNGSTVRWSTGTHQ